MSNAAVLGRDGVLPRPRRDWPAALRALKTLMADKNDTEQVFQIMRALNADEDVRSYAKLLRTRRGGRIAYERSELARKLTDRRWLDGFAEGTVGHAYRTFLHATGYSADGLAEISAIGAEEIDAEHPHAWVGRRSRDVHDLWHVLTGYKADEHLGEAALVAFSFAQLGGWGWGVIALATWLETVSAGLNNSQGRAIVEGYRLGRRAAWLMAEDYQTMMGEPLDAARKRLRIESPVAYFRIPRELRAEGLGKHAKSPTNPNLASF